MAAAALTLSVCFGANAQLGKSILQRAKNSAETKAQMEADRAVSKALDKTIDAEKESAGNNSRNNSNNNSNSTGMTTNETNVAAYPHNGTIMYVSVSTGAGSRSADGSQEKPYKDLQAAIDAAPEGALIRIAEGNYLGKMDQGFIEVKKYIGLEGGWDTGFTKRNPVQYITSIRPTEEIAKAGTSGSHALMDVVVKGKRDGTVGIDGILFDMGQYNLYCKPVYDNPVASAPEGCETGRIIAVGETPQGVPTMGGVSGSRQCLYGELEGQLIVRNCIFANAMHYGIQMQNNAGRWEISNNIFVGCRMAACEVRGGGNTSTWSEAYLDFHHNTVIFTWTRTKALEDMGYGFRYMTRMNYDVHDNLFGCNYYGALDRTRFDSDLNIDKLRKTNAYDNLFFANRMGDVCLPSGGGLWNFQYARNFEEVEQFEKYEGNREVNDSEIKTLQKAINDAYLKGYLGLTMSQTSNYQENSAMNTFRAAMGMNKQGTETIRVSMYGNRYPFDDIAKLWGVIAGKGAQKP